MHRRVIPGLTDVDGLRQSNKTDDSEFCQGYCAGEVQFCSKEIMGI